MNVPTSLRLPPFIRLIVVSGVALFIVFGCVRHGQKRTTQIKLKSAHLDPEQVTAYLEFEACISVVDSNIHAWSKVGALGELTSISVEDARSCVIYAKRASEYSMRALEIIAPYDSTLCEPARMISEFADLGCFYANSYLDGKGEAYAVKCQIQAGHAAAFLQDIQKVINVINKDGLNPQD